MRRSRRALLCISIAALCADQLLQRCVLADGLYRGQRVAPFDPPLFTRTQLERLEAGRATLAADQAGLVLEQLDPELGWGPRPGEQHGLFAYDGWGSRSGASALPARDEIAYLVAALGCSFTRGDEVEAGAAWPAVVDERRPELSIANFGVGGYGLDQALLRYRRDVRPERPDELWLGLLPAAALRNTTCFPLLAEHWGSILAFKPRFLLDESGELVLVPNPAPRPADWLRLLTDQHELLATLGATDAWIRRAPAAFAPRGSSWTHHFATTRLALTWHEGHAHRPWDWLADPESEAARLLVALILRSAREVQADGARLRVIVLPCRADLQWAERAGHGYWNGVVEEVRARGVEVLDTSAAFLERGAQHDEGCWAPSGHYSGTANGLVADAILAAWFGAR